MSPALSAQRPALVFALFAGLLGFAVAAFAPQIFHDGDTWWHLAAGGWMLDHQTVLTRDVFSFTFLGQSWDAQEWLAEIVMALAFRAASWNGLHLLFGLGLGVTAALVAGAVRARMAALPALLITLLGLACLSGSILARPHLLSLPLLALWTLELLRARRDNRPPPGWLFLMMLLWANLHGSFAFGLGLTAAFALEAALANRDVARGWGIFLLFSIMIAAVTPQGLHGLIFPFQLLLLGSIHNIGEWAPTSLTQPTPFLIALAGLFYLGVTGKLKLPWLRALIVVGLTALALAHVRHQMLFGIVVPLLLADSLGSQFPPETRLAPRWLTPLAAGLLILLVVARCLVPTTRGDDRVTPMTALAAVPSALRSQPVLNGYDFGGYLIFVGIKPYVDGRTDMYGDAFLADYDRMMAPDAKALSDGLSRWHIAWTILPPGAAAAMMDTLPGWRRLYSDSVAVVHIRRSPS